MEVSLAALCAKEFTSKAINHFSNGSEWIGTQLLSDIKLAELEARLTKGFGLAMARHVSIGEIEKELRLFADMLATEKLITDPAIAMKTSPTIFEIISEKQRGKLQLLQTGSPLLF